MNYDSDFASWLYEELGVSVEMFDDAELSEWYEVYLEEEIEGYDFFDW